MASIEEDRSIDSDLVSPHELFECAEEMNKIAEQLQQFSQELNPHCEELTDTVTQRQGKTPRFPPEVDPDHAVRISFNTFCQQMVEKEATNPEMNEWMQIFKQQLDVLKHVDEGYQSFKKLNEALQIE